MGYAYDELVAPAILFKNPGITKEEFVKLLDLTHTPYLWYRSTLDQAWDYYDPENVNERYHSGLEGLAHLLNLPNTEQFCRFQETRYDENDLQIDPPTLFTP